MLKKIPALIILQKLSYVSAHLKSVNIMCELWKISESYTLYQIKGVIVEPINIMLQLDAKM